MTDTLAFTIVGTPTPKGRPRFTRTGHAYTPAKTKVAEQGVLAAYLVASRNRQPHVGPVVVTIVAIFEPPTSWSLKKKQRALSGGIAHTSKPDLDNLVKIIDGLNGRAWVDDSQIVRVIAEKAYGHTARTEIAISFIEPTN